MTTSLKANEEVFIVTIDTGEKVKAPIKKTLLESLEAAQVEVHYHCRDGFCGACRVTLEQGQVFYPLGEPLAYVDDNEILPCCCVPVTNLKISIT
jgi:ferredoxin